MTPGFWTRVKKKAKKVYKKADTAVGGYLPKGVTPSEVRAQKEAERTPEPAKSPVFKEGEVAGRPKAPIETREGSSQPSVVDDVMKMTPPPPREEPPGFRELFTLQGWKEGLIEQKEILKDTWENDPGRLAAAAFIAPPFIKAGLATTTGIITLSVNAVRKRGLINVATATGLTSAQVATAVGGTAAGTVLAGASAGTIVGAMKTIGTGIVGADGLMVWYALDNVIGGTKFLSSDLANSVEWGHLSSTAAIEALQASLEARDIAIQFVKDSVMLNPILWPFKNLMLAGMEADNNAIEANIRKILAGQTSGVKSDDDFVLNKSSLTFGLLG